MQITVKRNVSVADVIAAHDGAREWTKGWFRQVEREHQVDAAVREAMTRYGSPPASPINFGMVANGLIPHIRRVWREQHG